MTGNTSRHATWFRGITIIILVVAGHGFTRSFPGREWGLLVSIGGGSK